MSLEAQVPQNFSPCVENFLSDDCCFSVKAGIIVLKSMLYPSPTEERALLALQFHWDTAPNIKLQDCESAPHTMAASKCVGFSFVAHLDPCRLV